MTANRHPTKTNGSLRKSVSRLPELICLTLTIIPPSTFFVLGAFVFQGQSLSDCNDALNGHYLIAGSTPNMPSSCVATKYYFFASLWQGQNYCFQICFGRKESIFCKRYMQNGTWSEWYDIVTT